MSRVLSLDEVRKLQFQTLQWMEFKMKNPDLSGIYHQYFLRGHMGKGRVCGYNVWWRVWDSQPSAKERNEVKWNCQISNPAPSAETRKYSSITIFKEKSPESGAVSARPT